jgi:hypothetical protein
VYADSVDLLEPRYARDGIESSRRNADLLEEQIRCSRVPDSLTRAFGFNDLTPDLLSPSDWLQSCIK